MISLTCYCDTVVEADVPEVYDLSRSPEVIDDIINGSFLNLTCPACGKVLKPELVLHFRHEARALNLYHIPETDRYPFLAALTGAARLETAEFSDPENFAAIPEDEGTAYSVVIGFQELSERMRLFKSGLDPQVAEIIKYFYLQKIHTDREIRIFFEETTGEKLVFHIHGLKDGEIGVASVPAAFYDKISAELSGTERKPEYAEIIAPPYISVNKIALEDEDQGNLAAGGEDE